MNATKAGPNVVGVRIILMTTEEANAWLAWLGDRLPPSTETHDVRYALAHSDSGVTWGYLDDQKHWKMGSAVDSALCPLLTARSLHELRVFGITAEVLIWRGDNALHGRILVDDGIAFDASNPLRPMDEGRCLRGECREVQDGFKRYVDAGGARHLAPGSFDQEFSVRHYFEQDCTTGAVRIAATRLVPEKLS